MPSPILRARHILAAVAAVAAALAAAGPAVASPAAERADEPPMQVRDYWTPARMRAAEPVETRQRAGLPVVGDVVLARQVPDSSAPGTRMHGRIFFSVTDGIEKGDYVCSGTAVNSRNGRVVWTAGHCVFDRRGGGYVDNWTFVPAYDDGAAPFGEWPAKRLLVSGRYHENEDLRYDFGAAVVARDRTGRAIQDVVGARGIAFNQPRSQRYVAYGYPAKAPRFEGNRSQYTCTSDEQGGDRFFTAEPRTMAIACDMTAGASGGGWVAPGGVVLSVTSYGYFGLEPAKLFGPYFGNAAKRVYEAVSRKRKPKRAKGKGSRGGKKGSRGGKKGGGRR